MAESEIRELLDFYKPKYFSNPLKAVIRIRLVEIENIVQPGTRNKNKVHIELYDRFKIGKINREENELILLDSEKNHKRYENGNFLCGRNIKNIKIFHSNLKFPTCKRCASLSKNIMKKGMQFKLYSEDLWEVLQNNYEEIKVLKSVSETNPKVLLEMSKILNLK